MLRTDFAAARPDGHPILSRTPQLKTVRHNQPLSVDEVIDQLYALPPQEFTQALSDAGSWQAQTHAQRPTTTNGYDERYVTDSRCPVSPERTIASQTSEAR
jgi:hypothetical protein